MNKVQNMFDSQEIGWDSEKPGYDGLIDVAHRIMVGRSNSEATEVAVATFLFPFFFIKLFPAFCWKCMFHIIDVDTNIDTLKDIVNAPGCIFVYC